MKDMKRFKTGLDDKAYQLALLLAPEMLTMLDLPTCHKDLPDKKYQLELRSFGVGVPVVGCTIIP